MAILTGVFYSGFLPFFICLLVTGTAKTGPHVIRVPVSGMGRGNQIVWSIHFAVQKVAGYAVDTFIAPIQSGVRFFSGYGIRDMASKTFFLGMIFRGINICLAGPRDGMSTFFPRLINTFVTFRTTLGIGSL